MALAAWGKWAESCATRDSGVGPPSRPSPCAPKAGGKRREERPQCSHAVPQPVPPPNVKQGEMMPTVKSCRCPPGEAGAVGKPRRRGKRRRTWHLGPMPLEDHLWPASSPLGSATRDGGGRGAAASAGHVPPCRRPRQRSRARRLAVRGRRGSRSVFACRGYTLPQPNYQQMSTGAPPAHSLVYGSRSREGRVRGSRGRGSRHGHYTCK